MRSGMMAIVGLAGRFPQAPDLDAFWELLQSGRDVIGPVPSDRWDPDEVIDPTRAIPRVGGFLDRVEEFDPEFFGISPREAQVTDPQQRLMLETTWRALEDAGEVAASLRGSRTGVYFGGLWHDYELLRKNSGAGATQHSIVGNSLDSVPSRVSYFLGLTGPSLTIESSCSSSLVALHQACQALRHGEIEAALVGGANLMLTPEVTVGLTHFGGLSPTGRCHAFGAGADGFVRGEGVVAVYVKTLERAVRDGDRVRAVIVASAVNNDGGGESLVTPNPRAQQALLQEVYGSGAVPLDKVVYVEAHGTGTVRGDVAETAALGSVLGVPCQDRTLHIGSVKTNIGHLEPAAGLAGLVKATLALEHGVVPPSLHAEELNPAIDFDGLNLAVAREPVPLAPGSHIGVNSFGWGGTNAHVVLTAAPGTVDTAADAPPESAERFLLPISAHNDEALSERSAHVLARLEAGAPIRDTAQALAWHRDHFAQRRALLAPELSEVAAGRARPVGKVAFVFPGQGAQWPGMGAGLYDSNAPFTRAMDECAEALARRVPWDVRDVVVSGEAQARVDQVQPALWAMSVSLAAAWRDAGVRPDVVVGHSQGEIAAATVAGALPLDDAALVVSRRSDLLRQVTGRGRMLAVDLTPHEAEAALRDFEGLVDLAVHNGPRSCVLAGEADAVLLLKEILETDGVFCRLIDVDYGSHSPQIDHIVPALREALSAVRPRTAHTPQLSTVDLRWLDGTELNSAYWAANLRSRVRFAEAAEKLLDTGVTHLVEVSPHPGLGTALRELGDARDEPLVILPSLRRGEGSHTDLLRSFGQAYVSGLSALGPRPARRPRAALPPYPFRRESYWVDTRQGDAKRQGSRRLALDLRPSTANGIWEAVLELGLSHHPWLADHRVLDTVVLPAGGYLALVQNALRDRADAPLTLRDVTLPTPLPLGDAPVPLAATWRPSAGTAGVFTLASGEENGWTRHCRTLVSWGTSPEPAKFPERLLSAAPVDPDDFYRRCAERSLAYGSAFRSVLGGHLGQDEALVEIGLPAGSPSGQAAGALHPVLWDGILQAALAVGDGPCVPVAIGSANVTVTGAPRLWVHARRTAAGFDLMVFDADRVPVGELRGVVLADAPAGVSKAPGPDHVFGMSFEPQERTDGPGPGAFVVCGRRDVLPGGLGLDALPRAGLVVFVAPVDGRTGLMELTEVIRRCLEENPSARLVVVVREEDPSAGLYAGFVAVVQAEYPQFLARLVEVAGFTPERVADLVAELAATEDRVVLRDGERLVGRRVRGGTDRTPAPWRSGARTQPFLLGVARPGSLDSLCRWPLDRSRPAAGRVEVAVEAASLNFIDVMKTMGVYPDTSADRDVLGLDCVGVVTSAGPGVTGVGVGDRVVACGFGTLASHVTVDARHVLPVPDGWSAAQAAALPMVLVTAWHALVQVARVERGDTVLVHSATGGLGLAALRIARWAGAEVIATAGTEAKRAYLRGLGVTHVFDSRGLDWVAGVRAATGGRGVDVVLNSLAGAAIPLGLEVLAEDGRFVEVGKRDIHAATSVELGAFAKSITFAAVDVAGLLRRRPDRFAALLREAWQLVETGAFGPLPVRQWGFADAEDAFRAMSRAEHRGKIVLVDPLTGGAVTPRPLPAGRFRAGGTYLITGGLGALGLSLAEYLISSGAGALALIGRSGRADPDRLAALRAQGVTVRVWQADVADEQRMRVVLDEIRRTLPPLRGVFHVAGVLDDATLQTIDADSVERVLRPKVEGARLLHDLTAHDALDLFVLFSSAAAFVGTAGQAAYAAANSWLDALVRRRRRKGLPGLSVQWGPVAGVGLAAQDAGRGDRLAGRGLRSVTVDACWQALRHFIETHQTVVAYAALDPRRWLETYPAAASLSSWQSLAGAEHGTPDGGLGLRLVPAGQRRELVAGIVRHEAALVLRLAPEKLLDDVPLRSLGLDSLMTLELRNRLEASLATRLSPTLLWKYGTLSRLTGALTDLLAREEATARD
ncbi:SDR family NAD(P)-dependent oxidoreductase [Streptomyces sp. NBC_00400]|uniref:type I polyketide synthase n=1 Tax=Streptomyces sp. NBC_00400 TaxID=2975737 RepID=UPI002E1C699F